MVLALAVLYIAASAATSTVSMGAVVTLGDLLTGWATVPRHLMHLFFLRSTPLDGDVQIPTATDPSATAIVASINVLLVGGIAVLLRRSRRIGRGSPVVGAVVLIVVLAALAAVGTIAALEPEFFYFTVLGT